MNADQIERHIAGSLAGHDLAMLRCMGDDFHVFSLYDPREREGARGYANILVSRVELAKTDSISAFDSRIARAMALVESNTTAHG